LARLEFGESCPAPCDYSLIQLLFFVTGDEFGFVGNSEELLASLGLNPEIDANEFTALNHASGFFECFADDGLLRGFAGFNVATGLAEDFSVHCLFFDKQESAIKVDDSSDCQIGWMHPCAFQKILDTELAKFHLDFTG
jgi:hypothetical protein